MAKHRFSARWQVRLLLPGCLLLGLGLGALTSMAGHARSEALCRRAETAAPEIRDGDFAYNQLTAREQQIYDAALSAAAHKRASTEVLLFVPKEAETERALRALFCDRPELCFLDRFGCTLRRSDRGGAVALAYRTDDPDACQAELDAAADVLLAELPEGDAYRKALYLHDALCRTVSYAPGGAEGSTAHDALVLGHADSFGYAAAYQLLCDRAGIPCETVTGTAGGVPHAWNCLLLDGRTGYTDGFWDDTPEGTGELPLHGYFNLPLAEMNADHTPDMPSLWKDGSAVCYYEEKGAAAAPDAELSGFFRPLLAAAQAEKAPYLEFSLAAPTETAVLADALAKAIGDCNADGTAAAVFRTETRIFPVSSSGRAYTVQLFYEEPDNEHDTEEP